MATRSLDALSAYVAAAHEAGCPPDQLLNFRRGGYVSTRKSLGFHAYARQADREAGPEWIGMGGARGPGKSHTVMAQVALDDCQRRDGLKWLFLRNVGKAAKESLEDLRSRVLRGTLNRYTRDGVIRFDNGSRIRVGHFKNESDVDQYLGIEYDGIVLEEATTLTHSKFNMLLGSLRTSRQDWRPRLYVTTNPGGVGHAWFKVKFIEPMRRGEETHTRFLQANVYDNPFINKSYLRYLEGLTGWLRRAWLLGDWDIAAGQFFTTWRHDVHVIAPFEIPSAWRVWCAMDYGFQHFTVVHLLAMDGDGCIYHVDEHAARRWQVQRHATAVKEMLARWDVTIDRLHTFVAGADVFAKKDEGPTIAEKYRGEGLKLKPANMDRVNGWAEMLARLGDVEVDIAPKWYVFETCPRLIETLPMLEHNPNRPEDVLKVDTDDDGIGGDDAPDAARYGLMAGQVKKMTSAQIDWYAKRQQVVEAPQPARSTEEIERLLDHYGE